MVLLPVALAAGLCSYELSARSLWIDEGATFSIASQHGAALWAGIRHDGGNMLVYYLVEHVLIGLFGRGALVLRLPAAVTAAVTVGAVGLLALRLFGERVALAAGLLAAVSLPLVYWGQDARAYAPMIMFVALSYVAFADLVHGKSRGRPGRPSTWAWLSYVAALVLAGYMSLVALLVVPAQLLSLLWLSPSRRDSPATGSRLRLRPVLSALLVTALCCAPLVVLAKLRGATQLFWVRRPDFAVTGQSLESLTSSALTPTFALTATSIPLLLLTLVLLAATAVVALRRLRSRAASTSSAPEGDGGAGAHAQGHPERLERLGRASTWLARARCGIPPGRPAWAGALVASWLVVPVLLILVESFVGQSIYQPRYMLISLPPVAILLAWGVMATGVPKWLAWGALGVLLVLRGLQIAPSYGVSPENWRAATRYVLSRALPGSCVAFYPSDGRMLFQYYLLTGASAGAGPGTTPRPVLPELAFGRVRPFVEDYSTLTPSGVRAAARDCSQLYLLSSHVGSDRGTPESRRHRQRFSLLEQRLLAAFGQRAETGFGYAERVRVQTFSRPGASG